MPRRDDIKSILIIGAGPIIIGQAGEFDYSGAQACKALKGEGYRVILVNSNPATIMTDPEMADATYIEPLTVASLEEVIVAEQPDALLPTMGGQTALNLAMQLEEQGILAKHHVELIGANATAIAKAEDREQFRTAMQKIGLDLPKSRTVHNMDEAHAAMTEIGLPVIIRPSYTLGGTGSGFARTEEEFERMVANGLDASPTTQVLIEESVLGWKEFEMEVVRDKADNAIIICSIENIDPMGVHTGDSITVAPAMTLTDKEYQMMRDASLAVIREIGVDTGGSNVQFAVCPKTGRQIVIEMNPRVSRSSALASKATGFPIAKIAALLAVGYTLDELDNDLTGGATPAAFEPTIDYVVVKLPRFDFAKFAPTPTTLGSAMRSVGEVMAIGRNFTEALQKGLRGLELGLAGLDELPFNKADSGNPAAICKVLSEPTGHRILRVGQALREGVTGEEIYAACGIDPWFIEQMESLIHTERHLKQHGLPQTPAEWLHIKKQGFCDSRIAALAGAGVAEVTKQRTEHGVKRVFKRVDTCAAEFDATTPYLYSTFEGDGITQPMCEAAPTNRKKVIILGGGPNRIGQGIEFDYCCVHAVMALKEAGYETIMVNCNPETVSTDYDTADRLYFEPLTFENVMAVIEKERENGELLGVMPQFGGQTPLKLAGPLAQAGVPILGTPPEAIDLAEDRDLFWELLNKLNLQQPPGGTARAVDEALKVAKNLGYPVLVRPSYVLGGRAMRVVHGPAELDRYMGEAAKVSPKHPVLIDRFLENAIEVDVDALCDGDEVKICGMMEHIEPAGVHSGDSACVLPPHTLSADIIRRIETATLKLAKEIGAMGLINVQFAVQHGEIYIIEANPRASRTVPFVAKAMGFAPAKLAARIMVGEKLKDMTIPPMPQNHYAVKEAVLPFLRFARADNLLGPEMKATGEMMGIAPTAPEAFKKAQMGQGVVLPDHGNVLITADFAHHNAVQPLARELAKLGFELYADMQASQSLNEADIPHTPWDPARSRLADVRDGAFTLAVLLNYTNELPERQLRRSVVRLGLPHFTTTAAASMLVAALQEHARSAPMALQQLEQAPAATAKQLTG